MQKRIVLIISSIVYLMFAATLMSNQVYAQSASTEGFGAVGVTFRQTVRVSVSNLGTGLRVGEIPPDPCRITIKLVNERGVTVAETERAIGAGETQFLEYTPDERTGRALLRAVVLVRRTNREIPPDPCIPTVEVLSNATGETRFIYHGTTRFVKEVD